MILHAQAKHGKPGLPWLVFLHGFSGDCHEWQEVGEAFADYSRLYVDLPGHGGSATISVDGFDDVTDLLCKTLVSYNILNFWLVESCERAGSIWDQAGTILVMPMMEL